MAVHSIRPERRTLHGHFSRDLAPVLSIDSGDTVVLSTLDSAWRSVKDGQYKFWRRSRRGKNEGHALCGPIEIRGAQPGMSLEIRIFDVHPSVLGRTGGGGTSNERDKRLGVAGGERHSLVWQLDSRSMMGRNQHGHRIALRPFMGVMGMPPPEPGEHHTGIPRIWGGNLDCKELIAGSTLFLPIPVSGGLFSVGDGHAVQGDGEVSGVGLECPMDRVELVFHLRDDIKLSTPRARTSAGWLTLGLHEDLDEASMIALNAMLDLMVKKYGLHRKDALAWASLVVDLRITQIVNGVKGVHAFLPHRAILS